MENLNEETKRKINSRSELLKHKECFTFVTHNNIVINAICVKAITHNYIDDLNLMDYIYLCYSQNRLFYIHLMRDMAIREYILKDLDQTLVDYCIVPEYDIKLAEYAK